MCELNTIINSQVCTQMYINIIHNNGEGSCGIHGDSLLVSFFSFLHQNIRTKPILLDILY